MPYIFCVLFDACRLIQHYYIIVHILQNKDMQQCMNNAD